MATFRIPILNGNTLPDTSGNVFYEPYNIKATNDLWRHGHWIFNDTATDLFLYGLFNVPKNYVGTASIIIVWTSTATSGNVVWGFDYRAVGGNDAESLDQGTAQESGTVTDAAPGATDRRLETSISLTGSNIVADDTVEFILSRDGTSGSDTMAAAAQIVGLYFQYADA
jgi:hypothetical protein